MEINTVVVFGTLSMVLYPLAFPYLGLSPHAFGIFVGSTIHEVAQVVVASQPVGVDASGAAVVEKMLRVMMLAPFLMVLSFSSTGSGPSGLRARFAQVRVPWFAVLFVVVSGLHSLDLLPHAWVAGLVQFDTMLLATAMAAMGLRTSVGNLRRAGLQPLKLGSALFVFLAVGGYGVNALVKALAFRA